jgi:hypothetical protein
LLDNENTIENSVDFLVRAYSFVKVNNVNVSEFLKAYCWRPVANMVDILGSVDFQLEKVEKEKTVVVRRRTLRKDKYGKPVYNTKFVKKTVKKEAYEASGQEGFHSRAFGDVSDLFGLVNPTVTQVLNLSADRARIAATLDVRKERRAAVRAYVEELTHSRGLMG